MRSLTDRAVLAALGVDDTEAGEDEVEAASSVSMAGGGMTVSVAATCVGSVVIFLFVCFT